MKEDLHHKKGKKPAAFDDIPEGYFDNLQQRIDQRIKSETEPVKQRPKKYFSVAALFILLFTMGFVGVYFFNNKNITPIQTASNQTSDTLDHLTFEFSALEYLMGVPQPDGNSASVEAYPADTLLNTMLSDLESDDIILYLLEKNEFEF